MNDTLHAFVVFVTVTGSVVIPLTGLAAFNRFRSRENPGAAIFAAIFIATWVALAVELSAKGFFAANPQNAVPNIVYGLVPLILGYLAFLWIRPIHDTMYSIPLSSLIGFQIYRILGGVFLIEYSLRRLPPEFALPAGCGDIAIGLTALLVAALLKRTSRHARSAAILWNVAGIADLVIAVATGFLSSPGPLQRFSLDAPNLLIGQFPLALIPVVGVPLSLLLHLICLHRLFGKGSSHAAHDRSPLVSSPLHCQTGPSET